MSRLAPIALLLLGLFIAGCDEDREKRNACRQVCVDRRVKAEASCGRPEDQPSDREKRRSYQCIMQAVDVADACEEVCDKKKFR